MIGHGVACYGAADRYLGLLAATLGDTIVPSSHFEAALHLNRQMGADTWLAHTAYEYGRMLLAARRLPIAREQLLSEAATLAETRRHAHAARACPCARADDRARRSPDGLSVREVDVLRLMARGPQQP